MATFSFLLDFSKSLTKEMLNPRHIIAHTPLGISPPLMGKNTEASQGPDDMPKATGQGQSPGPSPPGEPGSQEHQERGWAGLVWAPVLTGRARRDSRFFMHELPGLCYPKKPQSSGGTGRAGVGPWLPHL